MWRIIGLLFGVGLIWHGYNVFQTGVLVDAEIRGGVVIKSGEFTAPISIFLVIVGLWVLVSAVRVTKSDR